MLVTNGLSDAEPSPTVGRYALRSKPCNSFCTDPCSTHRSGSSTDGFTRVPFGLKSLGSFKHESTMCGWKALSRPSDTPPSRKYSPTTPPSVMSRMSTHTGLRYLM